MANRVPISVRLEAFEGPLDLLLYLIQAHEMDITRISIAKITDQYLAYVRLMQELNFDTASEFLVMAATLLHWKSKSLLPQENVAATGVEGEAELSPEDLIRQLIEHQKFMTAGQMLAQQPLLGEDVFTRGNGKPPVDKVWKEMSVSGLTVTYQEILARSRKRSQILKKETVSLSSKILEFRSRLKMGVPTSLRSLLVDDPSRGETVVTFLASLEVARLKKARLHQEVTYGEIYLELIEAIENLDISLAQSFDNPNPAPAPQEIIL